MKDDTVHELRRPDPLRPQPRRPHPLRRLWLLFAQVVTIALALWFVVAALRPEWLERTPAQVAVGVPGNAVPMLQAPRQAAAGSFRDAAARAMPSARSVEEMLPMVPPIPTTRGPVMPLPCRYSAGRTMLPRKSRNCRRSMDASL